MDLRNIRISVVPFFFFFYWEQRSTFHISRKAEYPGSLQTDLFFFSRWGTDAVWSRYAEGPLLLCALPGPAGAAAQGHEWTPRHRGSQHSEPVYRGLSAGHGGGRALQRQTGWAFLIYQLRRGHAGVQDLFPRARAGTLLEHAEPFLTVSEKRILNCSLPVLVAGLVHSVPLKRLKLYLKVHHMHLLIGKSLKGACERWLR